MTQDVQELDLHPGWLGKSVDILKLYSILHTGNLDAELPLLSSLHVQQPITIRQLASLSQDEMAAVAAPSLAGLHDSAAFSKDLKLKAGRNVAEMTIDVTCMGIVLNEALPLAFLQCCKYHLLDQTMRSENPSLKEIVVHTYYRTNAHIRAPMNPDPHTHKMPPPPPPLLLPPPGFGCPSA